MLPPKNHTMKSKYYGNAAFTCLGLVILALVLSLPSKLYLLNMQIEKEVFIIIASAIIFAAMVLSREFGSKKQKEAEPRVLSTGIYKFFGRADSGNLFLSHLTYKNGKVDFFDEAIYFIGDIELPANVMQGDVIAVNDETVTISDTDVEEGKKRLLDWYTGGK